LGSVYRNYLRLLLQTGIAGTLLLASLFLFLNPLVAGGLIAGYLLGFLFVFSNFLVVRRIEQEDQRRFLKKFFISIAIRFAVVLTGFAAVLFFAKINQILFTVSFIISYIFHSIIEIIFINKILENRDVK